MVHIFRGQFQRNGDETFHLRFFTISLSPTLLIPAQEEWKIEYILIIRKIWVRKIPCLKYLIETDWKLNRFSPSNIIKHQLIGWLGNIIGSIWSYLELMKKFQSIFSFTNTIRKFKTFGSVKIRFLFVFEFNDYAKSENFSFN